MATRKAGSRAGQIGLGLFTAQEIAIGDLAPSKKISRCLSIADDMSIDRTITVSSGARDGGGVLGELCRKNSDPVPPHLLFEDPIFTIKGQICASYTAVGEGVLRDRERISMLYTDPSSCPRRKEAV